MMHSGHRARLRQRFFEEGLSGFAPHEALELLLCFAIPQRDVNPLAHQLIERFGSLSAVLEGTRWQASVLGWFDVHDCYLYHVNQLAALRRACEV